MAEDCINKLDVREHPGLDAELDGPGDDGGHHLTPKHGLRRNYVVVSNRLK